MYSPPEIIQSEIFIIFSGSDSLIEKKQKNDNKVERHMKEHVKISIFLWEILCDKKKANKKLIRGKKTESSYKT